MYAAFYDAAGAIHQRATGSPPAIAAIAAALGLSAIEITDDQAEQPLETGFLVRGGQLVARGNGDPA